MRNFFLYSVLSAFFAALASGASPVAAAEVSLESRTYLPAWGTDGGETHALLYEYLAFNAEEIGPGLYLRAGGWGRADLVDETLDRSSNGDLQYAFVGWRGPHLNAEARLGRINLTSGVARNEHFDGVLLGSDLPAGFDIALYGGLPVEGGQEGGAGDTIYGARISRGIPGRYRVGASYLREKRDAEGSREEAGADVFFAPLRLITASGSSLYNARNEAWARHDYRLVLGPVLRRVRIVGTWASTDYRHFFQAPAPALFRPAGDERLERLGGALELLLGNGFSLAGEYTAYSYDISGPARAIGGRIDWAGAGSGAAAGYRTVRGDARENRYQEYRVHAATSLGPVKLAAGAEHLVYAEAINGETTGTTGSLSLGCALGGATELTATGEYGVTPEFEREIRGLFAVRWRYDASLKKGDTK